MAKLVDYYLDLPIICEYFAGRYFSLFSRYLVYPVELLIQNLHNRGDCFPEDYDLYRMLDLIDDNEMGFINALEYVSDLGLDYKKIIMDGVEAYFYELTDEVNLPCANTVNLSYRYDFYTIDVRRSLYGAKEYCYF